MGIRSDILAQTRRSICDAALDLFVEKGVAATKMEDILGNSGISVGSFYYLFKNKVDLAATLYLETQQQLFETLLDKLNSHRKAPAKEGIAALIRTYLKWVTDHPKGIYFLTFCRDPEVKNDEREKASEAEFYTTIYNWLQGLCEQGEIIKLTPQQYLALLFGPVEYLVRRVLDTVDGDNAENLKNGFTESAELLIEATWQGLRRVEIEV
jgi:AcrR family transcriptional regulator